MSILYKKSFYLSYQLLGSEMPAFDSLCRTGSNTNATLPAEFL
jgi:hypothetical protein